MIADFPPGYDGETFYSMFARFVQHAGLQYSTALVRESFGTAYPPGFELPRCLDAFTSRLVPAHPLTPEIVIGKHTAFPYISAFVPFERAELIKLEMKASGTTQMRSALLPSQWSKTWPQMLRFCPKCVIEARKQYSECYWQLVHQMPGVHVCAIHHVWLNNSTIQVRRTLARYNYVSAEKAIGELVVRYLDLEASESKHLLNLAADTAWLLMHRDHRLEKYDLLALYLDQLRDHGFVRASGKVRARELRQAFNEHYSPKLLRLLHAPVDYLKRGHSWLANILRLSSRCTPQPVQHLLLMRFLGYSVEEFGSLAIPARETDQPFGDGPWPCANPVCPQFMVPSIRQYRVRTGHCDHDLRALFTCSTCGLIYGASASKMRSGQLPSKKGILVTGRLWDEELIKLVTNSKVSITEAAARLGVGWERVKTEAQRLGVSFQRREPKTGARIVTEVHSDPLHGVDTEGPCGSHETRIKAKRAAWLEHIERHPGLGRTKLRTMAWRLAAWLDDFDSVWFAEHLPAPSLCPSRDIDVDWATLDLSISEQVYTAANALRSETGRPIRIKKWSVARATEYFSYIQKQLDKLPNTAQSLDEVVETEVEFAARKVLWAARCLRSEGVPLTKAKIVRRANVRKRLRNEAVRETVTVLIEEQLAESGDS